MQKSIAVETVPCIGAPGSQGELIEERKYAVVHLSPTRYLIPASETGGLGDIEVTTPEPDVAYSKGKVALAIARLLIDYFTSDDGGGDKKGDKKGGKGDTGGGSGGSGGAGGSGGSGGGGGGCTPVTRVDVSPQGGMTVTHVGCPSG